MIYCLSIPRLLLWWYIFSLCWASFVTSCSIWLPHYSKGKVIWGLYTRYNTSRGFLGLHIGDTWLLLPHHSPTAISSMERQLMRLPQPKSTKPIKGMRRHQTSQRRAWGLSHFWRYLARGVNRSKGWQFNKQRHYSRLPDRCELAGEARAMNAGSGSVRVVKRE